MKFCYSRFIGLGGAVLLLALVAAPSRADMKEWAGRISGGAWGADGTVATNGFTHGVAIYMAGGTTGNGFAITDSTGVHEYVVGFLTPGVYDPTGTEVLSSSVTDVDSYDIRNGARIFVADGSGIVEYLQSDVPWIASSTVAVGSGFTALATTLDQDRIWAIQNGSLREFDRAGAGEPTWAEGVTVPGSYVDVAARSVNPDIVFALRTTGFDEYAGGSLVRSHNSLFTGATGIGVWLGYDDVVVSTASGLLHLKRDPASLQFTTSGIVVIDDSTGYLDVDVPTESSTDAMVAFGVTSGGEVKRWRQPPGPMAFKNRSNIVGDFAHGVSVWMTGGTPTVLGLLGTAGVEEWLYSSGSWAPTGAKLALSSALDLASDDTRNGSRIFITDENGIVEYLWGGGWAPASTVAAGSGFTSGVITVDQDRFWAIQNGDAREFNRTSLTTWEAGVTITGDYVDVAARVVYPTAVIFLLRDTGIDEVELGQVVRSHNNLFSGATGIATWVDQDNLFVSTANGLLYLSRSGPVGFEAAGVRVIDAQPYRDVATSTEGGDIPDAILYCRGVTGLPVTGCKVPFADADGDSDVDQADFGLWQACFTGDGGMANFDAEKCKCFDRDHDRDVDGTDFQAFKKCWSGPAIAADPACGK